MEYEVKDKEIYVVISVSNKGKFRFKVRKDNFEFGSIFATRSKSFSDKVYLEWQIGYDATEQEIKKGKKKTRLTKTSFVGYNKKTKYLYELSELLYAAIKPGLISTKSLIALGEELKSYKKYLSDKEIDVQHRGNFSLNGLTFKETSIRLPTFFLESSIDGTQIEVSIQKQQYASGVQPMLYFSIPLRSFENGKEFYGRTSKQGDKLVYILDKYNASILLSLLQVFGMASPAHNHDIREIIKVLLK